jgi:IS5 family transposase
MLNYTPQNQLEIFNFKTEFESKLNPENRWIKMAKLLEWDSFAAIYGENFSTTMGAKGIDARVVIGALIIKHIESKDDRGTIEMISENPYMQFFLGLGGGLSKSGQWKKAKNNGNYLYQCKIHEPSVQGEIYSGT